MNHPRDNVPLVRAAETAIKANKLSRETLVLCTMISTSHLTKYHVFRKEMIAHPMHLANLRQRACFVRETKMRTKRETNGCNHLHTVEKHRQFSKRVKSLVFFSISLRTHRYPTVTAKLAFIYQLLGALGTVVTKDLRTSGT